MNYSTFKEQYPCLSVIVRAIAADNGGSLDSWAEQASMIINYVDMSFLERLACDHVNMTMVLLIEQHELLDAFPDQLLLEWIAMPEYDELQTVLEHHPEFKPLFDFANVAFGEVTPEELGYSKKS